MNKIYSFVGYANTGKTTYLEKLISLLSGRGYKIAVLKHTSHEEAFFLGKQGKKDTDKHFLAGANYVALVGPSGYSLVARQSEPEPEEIMALFPDADFIFTEGYKRGPYRKIEINKEYLPDDTMYKPSERFALVTDASNPEAAIFSIQRPEELAEYLIKTRMG
ncbi:molybdopterin-guanine dinucleotide biosynthesis protein B [Clostridia bacterium]|nr:molybdopterin-guanine dinucleotide biosynthesis protein B [Clostridia bacterium]